MSVKISVVIPFYNRMKYIAQLIESIPARSEIEVLIVDDKSEFVETEQLKAYVVQQQAVRNIKYFYNDEIKCAGTCRNIALRHAVGEWVLFADSDDYFMPDLYEKIAVWLDQPYDIVYFTPTSVDLVTKAVAERHIGCAQLIRNYQTNPCLETLCKLKSFFVVPWSKLVRRSLIEEHAITFDEVIASNDVMFSVKAAFQTERIATCNDVIYCVTKSPGSLMYSVQREVLDARLTGFLNHYTYLKTKMPKEIFATLALNGRATIMQYVTQKQPFTVVLGVVAKMVKHKIPLLEARLLNPLVIGRAIKGYYQVACKNRKYYKK